MRLVSDELADARSFGAPGTVGRSLRALFEVSGDLSALREAVSVLEGSPARLELAKALCALGEAYGRRRRAPPRAEPRARRRRHPGRRPRPRRARGPRRRPAAPDDDVLTWAERRALTLSRDGVADREIAEALFLAPFEVTRHLTSARSEARAMSDGVPAVGPGRAPLVARIEAHVAPA